MQAPMVPEANMEVPHRPVSDTSWIRCRLSFIGVPRQARKGRLQLVSAQAACQRLQPGWVADHHAAV